ncbi:MAG: hypothetical protein LIR50_05690 [Bacillota bacterium]|nr:hypothetical protein [Bacillota bacterium]
MLSVNNTDLTFPKSYSVILSDIDANSQRNANGELIRDRLCVKRKLEMQWQPLTQDEISIILTAVQDTFFDCTFLDPKDGVITKTMYVGDRTAPAYIVDEESNTGKWNNLKMDFIEK